MNADRYHRLKELFLTLRDVPPAARPQKLDQVCAGDDELRADLMRLLDAHDAEEGSLAGDPDAASADPRDDPRKPPAPPTGKSAPLQGDPIPGYQLLDEIHRGGQGAVYRAIQMSTKRKVAIKVLLDGAYASESARRRFEREVALVASLQHPNIIAIFDSGESADGRQFCVMDYVRGVPLNEFVAAQRLEANAALKIFRKVCDAVQYAHKRGVIHRDLKPANILVDAEREPRVLDFGLAKMVGGPEQTLVSMSGQVFGTLPYLSPEQAGGNPDEIDVRTDVYALGVILYEILTGQYPYPVKGQITEIIRNITETPPMPPSRRWMPDSGLLSKSRRGTPTTNCPVDADLDTIALKALAKEKQRRYQSAAELAKDIDNYLNHEPIEARRDSGWYVLRTKMRRNRAAFIGAVTVTLIAIASAVVVNVMHRRQQSLSEQAQQHQQDLADARTREAQSAAALAYDRLVYEDFESVDRVEQHLAKASALGEASSHYAIASALARLGRKNIDEGRDILERVAANNPNAVEPLYALSWVLDRKYSKQDSIQRFEQAEKLGGPRTPAEWFFRALALHFRDIHEAVRSYRQAIRVRAQSGGFFPQAVYHLSRAHNQLMYKQRTLEHFDEAAGGLKQLIRQEHYGASPHYLLSIAYRLAAEIKESADNPDRDAVDHDFAEALEWARKGRSVDPQNDRPIAAEAECLEAMRLYQDAARARDEGIELTERLGLTGRTGEHRHYRWRIAFWLGRWDDAKKDLKKLAALEPENRMTGWVYPALVYAAAGDAPSAVELMEAAIGNDRATIEDAIWSAAVLRLIGRPDRADEILDEWSGRAAAAGSWLWQLHRLSTGERSLEDLPADIMETDDARKRWGQAYLHAGIRELAESRTNAGLGHLDDAYRQFDAYNGATYFAKLILEQARLHPKWLETASPVSAGTPR